MGVQLSNEKYEFIKGEVVNIYERHNIKTIPISGLVLAKKLKIPVLPYSELSSTKKDAALQYCADGFTLLNSTKTGTGYIIYYNDDEAISKERRNMTMLHEIGHVVLDHRGSLNQQNIEYNVVEEEEAKFFAKYAASPPPVVDLIKPASYEEIAFYFGLSTEASLISWSYYNTWLNCKSERNKKNEEKLVSMFAPYIREIRRMNMYSEIAR